MATEIQTRVLRKITWRIVPFIMLLYFVAFIDRVNIGFASLTMNKDIGLSPTFYGFGAGIFFWGYFLFEVPSNIILHKVGARIWIARVMITWGIVSAAMAFVQGPTSFYALRFLLGVAEAGFFPGIILYLSYWFPARQRAAVTALFMAAAPLSTVLGSPVSGALLEMDGMLGFKGWQWLFVLEALPAVLLGFVVLAFLTDRPEKAKWLADDERRWLVETMNVETTSKAATAKHSIWRGLADPRVLALALIYFGTSAGLYTLGVWAPQIIKQFGLSSLQVGFLNALPASAAVVAMVLWARHSDRTGERTWHVVGLPDRCRRPRLCGTRDRRRRRAGRAGAREYRHLLGKAAAVEHADAVPVGTRGCGRHRHHQLDRQSRRLCRSRDDRLDQGPDRQLSRRALFRQRPACSLGGP